MSDEVTPGSRPPGAGADPTAENLALARAAIDGATDAEALKALDRAFKESKNRSRADVLREVATLAEKLQARSSGKAAKEAGHLAYAASQNVRLLERRAAVAGTLPASTPGEHQPATNERAPKPTRTDWLLGISWLGLCVGAGIVAGDAYATSLTADWSTRDFILGFVVIPIALGVVAGFAVRPRAPFVQSLPIVGAGAFVLAVAMLTQIDFGPGSESCPSGCEEDSGYAGVAFIVISVLPLVAGLLLGRLARRWRPL
jgi:hypothetical protein